jgi:hypothetical protein
LTVRQVQQAVAADYTSAAGVLNFAAGQTTASFTVTALTDSILESPETVNLVLFGGNVSSPSILTINDVPPTAGDNSDADVSKSLPVRPTKLHGG